MLLPKEQTVLPGIAESGPPLNPLPANIKLPEGLKQAGTSGPKLLATERSKASFSVQDMAYYIVGKENIERQARLLEIIIKEEAFDKSRLPYLGRTEKFAHGVRKDKRMFQLAKEHNWDEADQRMAEDLIDMPSAYGLHKSMFSETLRSQTSEEQKKLFLEPAMRYEMIGCYAQTELGHGSNVQGLETTATYDKETQEFVIHSPTITAAKWWAGGLGRTADHAIVMAQLYSNGKRRGLHPFLVPIRDKQSRKVLEGLTIGDIGPKAGYNTTDNGFMLFDNVRIPHVNMMARFSSIDAATGNYNKPASQVLAYGTMVFIRANIVRQSSLVLARAATVAIRYCAIRRQFTDRDAPQTDDRKPAESQVLNYQMVQYRLFPVLVQALAFHFCGKELYRSYLANVEALKKGDLTQLAETHASACALKCHVTIAGADAIETCRRACGGHGFSSASGLGSQYQDYLPQVTYEGDSYLLTQQTTRYLWKVFRSLWNDIDSTEFGTENITVDYLRKYIKNVDAKSAVQFSGDFHGPQMFVDAFGHRAAYLVGTSLRKRDIEKQSWNSLLVEIDRASHAHSQFIIVHAFAQVIMHDKELIANPALHHVLTQCFELYACHTMDKHASEFLSSGYMSPKQHELLRQQVDELLAVIRPQAVPLVDGFAIPDYLLASQLGRYDGNVYPNLLDFAIREPMNATEFNTDVNDTEIIVGQPRLNKL